MQWQFNYFSTALLTLGLINLALAGYAWTRRSIPGATPFVCLSLAVTIWSIGYALELASTDLIIKLLFARLEYFGIVLVPFAWLLFALQFTDHTQLLKPTAYILLAIVPIFTLVEVWTNGLHGLIWNSVKLNSNGSFSTLDYNYGPGFWLNISYSYLLVLSGTLLLTSFFLKTKGIYRQQATIILAAAFFPWIGNAFYIIGIKPVLNLDFTPFAFSITSLLAAWGFLRFELLDIIPLARDAVLEFIKDGVLVLDVRNRIMDINPAAQAMIGRKRSELVGKSAEKVFQYISVYAELFHNIREAQESLVLEIEGSQKYFELKVSPLYNRRGVYAGRLIVVQNITEQHQAKLALQKAHDELEKRVHERTSELEIANETLRQEIAERKAAEEALKHRIEIERLVTGISTNSMDSPPEDLDMEIPRSLHAIGEFARVDHIYIFRLSADGLQMDNTHEWCAEFIKPRSEQLKEIPCTAYPWLMQQLYNWKTIHIPGLAEIPLEAKAEGEFLQAIGVRSLIAFPLFYGKKLAGFLGFVQERSEKSWNEEDTALLRLVSEIFAGTFARSLAEEALLASEAELRAVFSAMTDTVLICDSAGANLRIAPTNQALWYESQEEFWAKTLYEIMPQTVIKKLLEQVRASLNLQKTTSLDYSLEIDGKKIWFAAAISPIQKDRVIIVARDITDRKASEEKLVHQALYDSLTGLPNRTLFMDRLERAIERVKRNPGKIAAVLFLDLDRFKVINDSLGHASGDLFLSSIAKRLKICMRSSDTVARFGGDEFAFLLEDISEVKEAIHIAERIQTELTSPIIINGHEVFTSGSIGIALAGSNPRQPEEILRDADMAMYRAKAKGKGCCETFDAKMHEEMAALLKLETDLRRAADRGELSLYYQPILDLNSGSIVSVEALLRWRHPQLGMLLPGQFLSIAEETRLINPIGEWVLWTACSQAKTWHDAGYHFIRVSINISARQFQEPQLLELVPRVLAETGLDPQYLELEVAEQAAMQDFDLTVKTLYELSRIGVRISIDDFGKGYSSLSYLKNFPTNTVKIDRSFVKDVNHNQHDANIASAIIAMAHTLQLNVVAEGVETKQQMNFLAKNQCDQIQGFLISKAVPDWELTELLQTRNLLQTAQLQFEI